MLPAHQRFSAGQTAADDVNDRLVIHCQFPALQGESQISLHRCAQQHLVGHGRFVFLVSVASSHLGPVHRQISVAQQGRRVRAVVRVQHDPETDPDVDGGAVQVEWFRKLLDDFLGQRVGILITDYIYQHQHEFIAAVTGHGIGFTYTGFQPMGGLTQQGIAPGVSQGIVNLLESVEVQKHQRHPLVVAMCPLHCLFNTFVQQVAIGQASERIIIGIEKKLLFRQLALGDVAEEGDILNNPPVRVANDINGFPRQICLAILVALPHLARPPPGFSQGLPEPGVEQRVTALRSQQTWGLADGFRVRVAGNVGEGGVDRLDHSRSADDHDRVRRSLEHGFGQSQPIFVLLALGDVQDGADDAGFIRSGQDKRCPMDDDRTLFLTGTQHFGFVNLWA